MIVILRKAKIILRKAKILLTSRYLFDNWFSLLILYILVKFGFNVKLKAKIGNCVLELNQDIFERLVSRVSRGLIMSVKCISGRIVVNDVEVDDLSDVIYDLEVSARVLGWNYDNASNCWAKSGIKFKAMHNTILEVFELREYSFVDVRDRDVVDVGAYVGDSAIYFALRGARRVIAIEPNPVAYQEMLENIRLNNLMDKVIPLNAGISNKHDKICIHELDVNKAAITYYGTGKHPSCIAYVDALTLEDIVERYKIPGGSVLKMDCEGCEFTLLDISCQILLKFAQIIIEYRGEPYSLINHLKECGFGVDIVKLWRSVGIMVGFK
jgi:FkbM family methyltransferase